MVVQEEGDKAVGAASIFKNLGVVYSRMVQVMVLYDIL